MVQSPVIGLQQAPSGCVHGFGEQVVPGPCQTFGAWQLHCVVTVQPPVAGLQQAPEGTEQGFGEQVVFAPCQTPVQAVASVTVQLPQASQQAPVGCGQGFGVQVVF